MDVTRDLRDRWQRARIAALRTVASGDVGAAEATGAAAPTGAADATGAAAEERLLLLALERDKEATLRAVFDNSRKLGLGFRVQYKVDVPLRDIANLLPHLGTPCHSVAWQPSGEPHHFRSERPACGIGRLHARACAYFREATDGLVVGLSSSVHFARHESIGGGGTACVDVLFVQPTHALRFGPIPESMRPALDQVTRMASAFDASTRLEFLGISEGVLFYTVQSGLELGRVNPGHAIRQALARRYPTLEFRDVTPRSVPIE